MIRRRFIFIEPATIGVIGHHYSAISSFAASLSRDFDFIAGVNRRYNAPAIRNVTIIKAFTRNPFHPKERVSLWNTTCAWRDSIIFRDLTRFMKAINLRDGDILYTHSSNPELVFCILVLLATTFRLTCCEYHISLLVPDTFWVENVSLHSILQRFLQFKPVRDRIFLYSQSRGDCAQLEKSLAHPVSFMPHVPAETKQAPAKRRPSPFLIGQLGFGRGEKGFFMMKDIIDFFNDRYKSSCSALFIFQDCFDDDRTAPPWVNIAVYRSLVRALPNVIMLPSVVSQQEYDLWLRRLDIFLLPYDNVAYQTRASGVVWDAIARSCPFIYTHASTLGDADFGDNAISATGALEFAHALARVVTDFEKYSAAARIRAKVIPAFSPRRVMLAAAARSSPTYDIGDLSLTTLAPTAEMDLFLDRVAHSDSDIVEVRCPTPAFRIEMIQKVYGLGSTFPKIVLL